MKREWHREGREVLDHARKRLLESVDWISVAKDNVKTNKNAE